MMSKNRMLFSILLFIRIPLLGQETSVEKLIDSLRTMKADTLDCQADIYWKIVAHGKKAIPLLIDKLNDTGLTNVSYHCKPSKLNVGDIAYEALEEITEHGFPIYEITGLQFCVVRDGCWSFYEYLYDNSFKGEFKMKVKIWYSKHKSKLRRKAIPEKDLSECHKKYGIKYYFDED